MKNTLVITIENRNYESWTIHNMETMEPVSNNMFDPITHKLFSMDVFTPSTDNISIKRKISCKKQPIHFRCSYIEKQ